MIDPYIKKKILLNIKDLNIESPYFIFLPEVLEKNIKDLKKATNKYFKKYRLYYSVKTNYLPEIIKLAIKNDIIPEVISGFELELIEKIKMPKTMIQNVIVNGPVKSKKELKHSIIKGYTIHIDSVDELMLIKKITEKNNLQCKIAIRISNDSKNSKNWTKFGILEKDLEKCMLNIHRSKKINLIGLHYHLGGNIDNVNIYKKAAQKIVVIIKKYKINLEPGFEYVDLGGGFPGAYRINGDKNFTSMGNIEDYLRAIYQGCGKFLNSNKINLILEPGRYLVDESLIAVTEVHSIKKFGKRTKAFVDLGSNALPSIKYKEHAIEKLNNIGTANKIFELEGPLCMGSDSYISKFKTNSLDIGDKLIVFGCGAYSISQAMNFIKKQPKVYLLKNKKIKVIRKQASINHIAGI